MPNQTFYSKLMKYQPMEDKGNHVKVDSHTWLGIVVDTWKMDEKEPYLQMVGYFNTAEGKEILLARKNIKMLDVKGLEFFNERRQFFCNLSTWSFHGFADNLHYEISADDLVESRKVIDPGSPADAAVHETTVIYEKLEIGGKMVYFEIKSTKKTKGPFEQRLLMYVLDDVPFVSRQFAITLPVTTEPFIKLGDYFELHKVLIAETLGLTLGK